MCIVAVALSAATWAVLVEGTLLRHSVATIIGWRLNARCTIDRFDWNGWNRAVIRGLTIRVKDWPDAAAEVIRIGEMNADFDPLPLLWGSLALTDISVDRMTIASVVDDRSGRVNLFSLQPPEVTASSRPAPRINIRNLDLRIGSLDPARGKVHFEGRYELSGSLANDGADRGLWTLHMEQRAPGTGAPGARIVGALRSESFDYEIRLTSLKLDEALRRVLPEDARRFWPSMDLEAKIDSITLAGDRDQVIRSAKVAVSDISLTMPDLGVGDLWAVYTRDGRVASTAPPRIRVSRGEMDLNDWVLTVRELRGELTSAQQEADTVALPVSVSLWMDLERGRLRNWSLDGAAEWVAEAIEHAPFGMHLEVARYVFNPVAGAPTRLVLPRLAAEILDNFMVQRGRVSINAFVTRDNPVWRGGSTPGDDAPREPPIPAEVRVQGGVFIDGGEGGYRGFPYMLSDVRAQITFEDDLVRVESLRGRGSEGSEISISGTVIEPGDDAGVDLRIITARAPIDQVLIDALVNSPAQRFLKLLFCMPAFESLKAAGLPARVVEAMRSERMELVERLEREGMHLSSDARQAIASRIVRLGAADWLAKFKPGGWCSLDLNVQRDVDGGDLIRTTGTITLLDADALCEPLPYPIRVLGREIVGVADATITIEDERILLPAAGLSIALPGGGTGTISGQIDLPRDARGDRIVKPMITVSTEGDALNELLLASIPADDATASLPGPSRGWPGWRRSEAAQVLERIGLEGDIASTIEIGGDGRGEVTWRVRVELTDGRASPSDAVGSDLAESGLQWPAGFSLERCEATLRIDDRLATLERFSGVRGDGRVHARGTLDLGTGEQTLDVDFLDISPGEYLVNLLPRARRERGQEFWRSHEPAGRFSASLAWRRDPDHRQSRRLELRPSWIEFTTLPPPGFGELPRHRVRIEHRSGDLLVVDAVAAARSLEFVVEEPERPPSTLRLDGAFSIARDGRPAELEADWLGAHLESTLLLEGLHLAGVDRAVELWSQVRPRGRFDGSLRRIAAPDAPTELSARLRFDTIGATIDGAEAFLQVDPASPQIVVQAPFARLDGVRVATANGRFELRGVVPLEPDASSRARLFVDYEGERFGPPEMALLGGTARRAIEAIDLACDGPVRVDDGEILFERDGDRVALGFRGAIELERAKFRAGVRFTDLDAMLDLHVPPSGGADLWIRSPRFRVMDYAVEDAAARVRVSPAARRITVEPLMGLIAGGSASARALVHIDPESVAGGDYSVQLTLVGAHLAELPLEHRPPDTPSRSTARRAAGRVDGTFTIGGAFNQPWLRTGRGRVEIRDGRMAELPITMSLLQVSQLMLPLNTSLHSGDIRFHIDGDRLVFERFDLTCPTLEFLGTGEFNLRDDELSLRFRNRGTLPIWSDLFAAVSQTLWAIDVTGPLRDPRVSVAPLPPFNKPPIRARAMRAEQP